MNRSTTTSTTHRPSRRQRAKAADPAQVRGIPEPMSTQISKANRPTPPVGGIPDPCPAMGAKPLAQLIRLVQRVLTLLAVIRRRAMAGKQLS